MSAETQKSFTIPPISPISYLPQVCTLHDGYKSVAIKHHEVDESFTEITYEQLDAAQLCVHEMLVNTKWSNFVGISSDIPAQCLPGLMFGIMTSGRAFVCLPASSRESKRICDKLNICHIFVYRDISGFTVIQDFTIHEKRIFLTQVKDPSVDSQALSKDVNEYWCKFAYATTTSGSTGEPKIVRVTHSSIIPNIIDLKRILLVSKNDTIAQITPVTFDPSVIEIFLSLSCNATLLTASQELKNDPQILLKTLVKSKVTVLQTTPSLLLQRWSNEELKKSLLGKVTDLRILLLGGEDFPNDEILTKIRSVENKTKIFNIYGITEVSCWASICDIQQNRSTDGLGEVLSETIFEVGNKEGIKIQEGEGILYIGSKSRGCLIDDEDISLLNSAIFRNTGDLALIQNGHIILKGRQDRQIKRYGTKVDLTILESCVRQLSFVENCRALFNYDNQSLHLYFTIFNKSPSESEKIKYNEDVASRVTTLLNIYRPDKVFLLNRFELTPHGKICDNYLKNYSVELPECSDGSEKGSTAETLHNIWKRYLPFNKKSGFIDLGGSSIVALRIADELASIIGHKFPELIGHLLRNENLNNCQAYVERETANLSKRVNDETNIEKSSSSTIDEPPKRLDSKESGQSNIEKSQKQQKRTNPKESQIIIPWLKCRGKSSFPLEPLSIKTPVSSGRKQVSIRVTSHYDLDKCVDASPTIFCYPGGNNYVTVGSHAGVIFTVTLSGLPRYQWKVSLPDRIEASILVVNDFRGIVGSYDGYVYCLDLKTGEIFWKFKTGDAVKCTAVLCSRKKNVFFGSYDRNAYCVSLENGSEVWYARAGNGSISATPCIHDELDCVVFASLDGTCISFKQRNGRVNWVKKLHYPIFSGPVILDDGICVFCDVSGRLDGIFVATGEKAWGIDIGGKIFSHLHVHTDPTTRLQSIVFGSENKHLYKFDCRYETICPISRFVKNIGVPIISTPSSDGQVIVVAGIDGTVKICKFDDGALITNYRLDAEVFSSPLIHENFIVVGCRDNCLYILFLDD